MSNALLLLLLLLLLFCLLLFSFCPNKCYNVNSFYISNDYFLHNMVKEIAIKLNTFLLSQDLPANS